MRYESLLGMPARFGVVEIAFRIYLQTHGEFVKVLRDLMVIVQALVKIGFAIAVQIMKNGQRAGPPRVISLRLTVAGIADSGTNRLSAESVV